MGVPLFPRSGSPAESLGVTFITWGLYLPAGTVPAPGHPGRSAPKIGTHTGETSETRKLSQDALSPGRGAKVGTYRQLQP